MLTEQFQHEGVQVQDLKARGPTRINCAVVTMESGLIFKKISDSKILATGIPRRPTTTSTAGPAGLRARPTAPSKAVLPLYLVRRRAQLNSEQDRRGPVRRDEASWPSPFIQLGAARLRSRSISWS